MESAAKLENPWGPGCLPDPLEHPGSEAWLWVLKCYCEPGARFVGPGLRERSRVRAWGQAGEQALLLTPHPRLQPLFTSYKSWSLLGLWQRSFHGELAGGNLWKLPLVDLESAGFCRAFNRPLPVPCEGLAFCLEGS